MEDIEYHIRKKRAALASSAAAAETAAETAETAETAAAAAAAGRVAAAPVGGLECTDRCVCGSHVFAVRFHPSNPKLLAAAALSGMVELHRLPEPHELQQHLQQQQQQRDKQRAIRRLQRRNIRQKQQKQQQQQQSLGPTRSSSSNSSSSSSSSSSESSDDEESPEKFLEADLEQAAFGVVFVSSRFERIRRWVSGSSIRSKQLGSRWMHLALNPRIQCLALRGEGPSSRVFKRVGFEAIEQISATAFASADEDGRVSLWDTRQQKPLKVFPPEMPGVARFKGTGTPFQHVLHVWLLAGRGSGASGGSKICCSSDGGELLIFNWGDFGDYRDRITDIQTELNALAKFDEDTLLAGCGDGCVRVVQLHPNRLAGILAGHGKREGAVEALALNCDQSLLATAAHDERLRIHDATQSQQPQHDLRSSRHFFDDL
ncbi:hypothetical protein ACSSS7_005927 [Eimeria intestinalis]